MDALMILCILGCAACLVYGLTPLAGNGWERLAKRIERYQVLRVSEAAKVFDDMFLEVKPGWLVAAYRVAPLAGGLLAYLFTNNLIITVLAGAAAMVIPDVYMKIALAQRRMKFNGQLVDALFMLSSSLRAGLSLTQAFETLETEMAPPASQEFGLMMKAHRVGLSFDDALQGMNRRMGSEELNLIVTAMLLARSTGGDVTRIIQQLIVSIREKKKLNEKVIGLTLQGKLQAVVMSALPVFFAFSVRSFNPDYFTALTQTQTGQTALLAAIVLWLIGMVLLFKLSKVEY
jgi:tight adherence protein B